MKTNFKVKFISSLKAVILILLFLTVVQFIFPQSFSFVEKFRNYISVGFNSIFNFSTHNGRSCDELIEENKRLRNDLRNLVVDYVMLEKLVEENKELKENLKIYTENNGQVVVARIIGRQKINNNKFIVLNKGRSSGIDTGQPVIIDNNFLVGIISYVSSNTSYVSLINENSITLSAKILNAQSKVQGVVQGMADLSIIFDLIPKELDIKEGDLVVTSGLDLNIPPNLIIGQVDSVEDKPSDFFKTASIKPLALVDEYEYVSIITAADLENNKLDIPNL